MYPTHPAGQLARLVVLAFLAAAGAAMAQDQQKRSTTAKPEAARKSEPAKPEAAKPDEPEAAKANAKGPAGAVKPLSFLSDVAPVLVRNCIACHNPKKSEGKYVMTTFAQLAKGGKQGEGITLVPGKPDDSYFIDLLQVDAEPRMPYKLDPLPAEEVALLSRWVSEGAKYDGSSPSEDWTFLLRRTRSVSAPERYPVAVPVTALAFTPDGSRVVASGYHELTFWKAADGALDSRLKGFPERTHDLAYSPDGKWLAVAGGDPGQYGIARLCSVASDGSVKPVRDLAEGQDVVFAAAFSPDGKTLATAGADRVIRLYETESGKLLAQIEDHADWIFALAFSPDGKRLASASRDKTSKVFDVARKESLVTFPGHAAPVHTLSFTPDGKAVASGGEDNQVRMWTMEGEAKQVRAIGGFGGAVFKLRYMPDGKAFLAAGADKTVRVLKAENGSAVRKLEGHADWIYSLAVSRDGKTIASGGWDGEVRLWNADDGKPLRTLLAAPGLKTAAKN